MNKKKNAQTVQTEQTEQKLLSRYLNKFVSYFKHKQNLKNGVSVSTTAKDLFKENKDNDILKLDYLKPDTPIEFNKNKPSILLFDDNMGVISVLEDDINDLHKKGFININDYNILKFTSPYAAFQLNNCLKLHNGLNIKYAIFDLTLGGGVFSKEHGNIVLDGVDAFIDVSKYNKDLKYIFFTGNKLNKYINKNKDLISKFTEYTNKDIEDYILFKTELSPKNRREFILNFLTK